MNSRETGGADSQAMVPGHGPNPVRGIIVAHGGMAEGMADAVRKISGIGREALVPLSNEGCSPETLFAAVKAAAGDSPAIIFTDLQSGSCALAARISCKDAERAVVAGVNLPILLDFVFNRTLPLGELVDRLVDKGKDSVQNLPAPKSHADSAVSD